jgi:hypothetical protein
VLLFACGAIDVGDRGHDFFEAPDVILGHEITTLHVVNVPGELRLGTLRGNGGFR